MRPSLYPALCAILIFFFFLAFFLRIQMMHAQRKKNTSCTFFFFAGAQMIPMNSLVCGGERYSQIHLGLSVSHQHQGI